MASLVLNPMITKLDLKPDLPAISTFPPKCNLNHPVWNSLVGTNEVICHRGVSLPLPLLPLTSNSHDKDVCWSFPQKKIFWPEMMFSFATFSFAEMMVSSAPPAHKHLPFGPAPLSTYLLNVCMCESLRCVQLFVTPKDCSPPASSIMEFSRQEH